MTDLVSPYSRLRFFLDRIGIEAAESEAISRIAPIFVEKKDDFAEYFHDIFLNIADTKHFLDSEKESLHMKRVWAAWFANFFKSRADDEFLTYLWGVGVRHVEVNLDQRFTNLGFAMIRQFCNTIVASAVPEELRNTALSSINKKLDLCLLVETAAYIENTISCDIEVMREVADRVRNPAMVIGWNIKRLQRKVDKGTREYDVYQMLMAENQRLENMVRDIKVYMDVFQNDPEPQVISLDSLINSALEKLHAAQTFPYVHPRLDLHPDALRIRGDRKWMEHLFYYLLENSMEAAGQDNGFVKVSSRVENSPPFSILIEIANSGIAPTDEAEKLFTPFFSTKVEGTGFGLPIARLVARKHHGMVAIEAGPPKADSALEIKVMVTLPNPARSAAK